MKKEEPSICSMRENPSSLEETTGSLSRQGLTATAQIEKALSLISEFLRDAVSMIPTLNLHCRGFSGFRLKSFVEPPYADPHVRWRGGRRQQ